MIFTDKLITIDGTIENAIDNGEGQVNIINECHYPNLKGLKDDVFECIPSNSSNPTLNYNFYMDTYNIQYNETKKLDEIYDTMPSYYSIYILGYDNVTISKNASIRGSRIGM